MPIKRRIIKTFSRLFHVTQLLKKENWLAGASECRQGIAKFIALAFTFSSELEILSFHVVIVHAGTTTKKLYKKSMVTSCRFAYFNTHSLVDIVVAVVVLKGAGATRTAKEQ